MRIKKKILKILCRNESTNKNKNKNKKMRKILFFFFFLIENNNKKYNKKTTRNTEKHTCEAERRGVVKLEKNKNGIACAVHEFC